MTKQICTDLSPAWFLMRLRKAANSETVENIEMIEPKSKKIPRSFETEQTKWSNMTLLPDSVFWVQ